MDYQYIFTVHWTVVTLILLWTELGDAISYGATLYCASNNACNTDRGEVCWRMFDGCEKGQCMCDPRTEIHDESGQCKIVKLGGESCNKGDQCIGRMQCSVYGKCFCRSGVMTTDRRFCKRTNDRMLGSQCNTQNICYQKRALEYVTADVQCTAAGYCQCDDGFKEDNGQCRKWNIGESGCTQMHQCQGGALCLAGRCSCPAEYQPYADNTRCAKRGARTDLKKGERCDEVHERSYCALGLICQQCDQRNIFTCVKYINFESRIYTSGAAAPVFHVSMLMTSLLLFICLVQYR